MIAPDSAEASAEPDLPLSSNTPKGRDTAILLAVLFGFFTWAYTYREDRNKFWLGLVLSLLTGLLTYPILWFWAIAESIGRTREWYESFPNGNLLGLRPRFVMVGSNMALGGAALLVISCFLPWFRQGGGLGEFQDAAEDAGLGGGSTFNAFDSVETSALLLVALALLGVFIAFRLRGDPARSQEMGYRFGLFSIGVVSLAILILNVVFPPQIQFLAEGPMDPWVGIFPAFLAAALLLVGGSFVIRGDLVPATTRVSVPQR